MAHVDSLREVYRGSRTRHELAEERDYVRHPKDSGYRSIHLVYRYHSDRNDRYNGLRIELQLRTHLQHAWATAVETVGTFLGQSLKASQGGEDWLRFFELIGSGFALAEGGPVAHNVPADSGALRTEISNTAAHLRVKETLEAFGRALIFDETYKKLIENDISYYLFMLRPEQKKLTAWPFRDGELKKATEAYLTQEKNFANTAGDTVLVASDSLESLRRAFPNYFLDTRTFVEEMDRLLA